MDFTLARLILFAVVLIPQLLACSSAKSAARVFLDPNAPHQHGSAVDAKGVRHNANDYHGNSPWLDDAVKMVSPNYPYEERRYHHEGTGIIQLILDIQTGSVVKATVMKSTGFKTLDNCAISAFRQWRWKPGKWKEVDMGLTFRIHDTSTPLPRGAVRVPASD